MNGVDRNLLATPFPRLGEVVRWLAGVLDTRSAATHIARDLDRFAREQSFNLTEGHRVFQEYVTAPLSELSPALADLIADIGQRFLDEYAAIVLAVQVDALERADVLTVATANWFPLAPAGLLVALAERQPGPDLAALLDADRRPVAVVFDWFVGRLSQACSVSIDRARQWVGDRYAPRDAAGRGKDTERDNALHAVRDWIAGARPSLGSIKLLKANIEKSKRTEIDCPANLSAALGMWLVVARALDEADEECREGGGIRQVILQTLLAGVTSVDIGLKLSTLNGQRGQVWLQSLTRDFLEVANLTRLKGAKADNACAQAEQALKRLEAHWGTRDLPIGAGYMLHWQWARYFVLSNRPELALDRYVEGFALAAYRGGSNQQEILRELLTVAAHRNSQVAIRNHYRWATAFGLFNAGRSEPEPWEVERLQQQFQLFFPLSARYPDAPTAAVDPVPRQKPVIGFMPDIQSWKTDLKKPDRRVNLGGSRKPQLCWTAYYDRVEDVDALLAHGADINVLSDSNESALFLAVACAIEGQGSQSLERLLREPGHRPSSLNAVTVKKQATALQYAIELADPEVARRLLALGADPNLRCTVSQMTPLYYAMQLLYGVLHPRESDWLLKAAAPDSDVLRRYSPLGGVFDQDQTAAWHAVRGDRSSHIGQAVVETLAMQSATRDPVALRSIIATLLECGADPNAMQCHIKRNPVHFASEIGDIALFNLLEENGGQRDSLCWQLACDFHRLDLAKLLAAPIKPTRRGA